MPSGGYPATSGQSNILILASQTQNCMELQDHTSYIQRNQLAQVTQLTNHGVARNCPPVSWVPVRCSIDGCRRPGPPFTPQLYEFLVLMPQSQKTKFKSISFLWKHILFIFGISWEVAPSMAWHGVGSGPRVGGNGALSCRPPKWGRGPSRGASQGLRMKGGNRCQEED